MFNFFPFYVFFYENSVVKKSFYSIFFLENIEKNNLQLFYTWNILWLLFWNRHDSLCSFAAHGVTEYASKQQTEVTTAEYKLKNTQTSYRKIKYMHTYNTVPCKHSPRFAFLSRISNISCLLAIHTWHGFYVMWRSMQPLKDVTCWKKKHLIFK